MFNCNQLYFITTFLKDKKMRNQRKKRQRFETIERKKIKDKEIQRNH